MPSDERCETCTHYGASRRPALPGVCMLYEVSAYPGEHCDKRARLEAAVVQAALAERRTFLRLHLGFSRYVKPAAAEIVLRAAVDALLAFLGEATDDAK